MLVGCHEQTVVDNQILLTHNPFSEINEVNAQKILNDLTLEEKIGQLLIYSPEGNDDCTQDSLDIWVENGYLGGVILQNISIRCFSGKLDTLQNLAPIPLFVGTHQLVSQSNLFTDTPQFPNLATMGSIRQDSFHQQMADLNLRQTKALGINFCIGPSININSESDDYDFNVFKNNWESIRKTSYKFAATMQVNKILSIARSITDIQGPTLLDSTWIYNDKLTFEKEIAQNGISGFLVDEQIIKENKNHPTSNYLQNFVQQQMGFQGLLISQVPENDDFLQYFRSGTDIFIINQSPFEIVNLIKTQIASNIISIEDINRKALKSIKAKQWLGFEYNRPPKIDTISAYTYNQHPSLDYFAQKLYKASVSVPNNYNCTLPLNDQKSQMIKWMKIGKGGMKEFQAQMSHYYGNTLSPSLSSDSIIDFKEKIYKRQTLVLSLDQINVSKTKDSVFIRKINDLSKKSTVIIVNFGNPNNLLRFDSTCAMIHVFETNHHTEKYTAQTIFGGIVPIGISPIKGIDCKHGFQKTRIAYSDPEEVGIDHKRLYDIRAYVNRAIRSRAIPGCQILVAKSGNVIYNKSFGYHTYSKKKAVKPTDLYDIASLTKTTATTVALMKLMDQKKVFVGNKLKDFFTIDNNWRLANITVNKLLLHQSGLQPNMPIGQYIRKKDNDASFCNKYLCTEKTDSFNVKIANKIWFKGSEQDEIWNKIKKLKPKKRVRFRYSDINFVILQKIIEKQSGKDLDDFCNRYFYYPLQMDRCLFNPRKIFPVASLIPTARDDRWRKQLIQGYVHDESAALLSGVAGNAGLFANSESLVPLYQMLLNKGEYGGRKYIKKATVESFTKKQYGSKRALGFDRLDARNKKQSCSKKASSQSYGHTGFTGTMVWVDPKYDLIFIFLSNRIYPNPRNWKLNKLKIRNKIHDVVYKSLDTYHQSLPDWNKLIDELRKEKQARPIPFLQKARPEFVSEKWFSGDMGS